MRNKEKYYEMYEFIVSYVKKNLNAPTIREICEGVGIRSTGTVSVYLQKMEQEQLVKLVNHKIILNGYMIVPTEGKKKAEIRFTKDELPEELDAEAVKF